MDLIHKFLNIATPMLSLIFAALLPPYMLIKFLISCLRSISKEKLVGKVVLITGASSGIGEHVAYEYAKRGACLVLVARREDRLLKVASNASNCGSPEVIVVPADVSKLEECSRFVDEAINHFGRLDHLVTNAGILSLSHFEDCACITDHASIMNINFWGSVYSTQFAIPYLRKSQGKIVVIASAGAWFCPPRLSIYNASKAALISFYETLRTELVTDIGITIVNPGMIESEMTNKEYVSKANVRFVPLESTKGCAKAILNSTLRGDKYLTEPAWMNNIFLWKLAFPEVVELFSRCIFGTRPEISSQTDATSKGILEATWKDPQLTVNSPDFKTSELKNQI